MREDDWVNEKMPCLRLLIDTSNPDYDDEIASEIGATHHVIGRSLLLFRLAP